MIQRLFNTAREISELSPKLCTTRLDERLKMADLLELIGHIVADAENKLQLGKVPASKSRQIALLSEELYFRLASCVGEIKARSICAALRDGYEAVHQSSEPFTSDHLITLEKTIGYFLETSGKLIMSMARSN